MAYDFNAPVTSNLVLVSYFADPAGDIMISTVDEFYYMATVESTYSYKRANDLDFTSYTWAYVNTSFKGTFDGQNYTISNITIVGTVNVGIFAQASGSTITNLVIDNASISTTTDSSSRASGALVGRIQSSPVTIENIVVKNSDILANHNNGAGGLVGNISENANIFNVAVINTEINNTKKNAGGLIGRIDTGASVIADDIFVSQTLVKSTDAGTSDVGASALIGYIAESLNSSSEGAQFSGIRIVVLNTTVDGNVAAAFVEYNRYPGTADLQDAYFKVTFVNNERSGLIGYNREQVNVLDQSSIFGSLTNNTTHSLALALENTAVPTDTAWWTTNLNNIATSSTWVVSSDGSVTLALLVG